MTEQDIFEKVKNIIVEQIGVEEEKIEMNSTIADDLSADSLDMVEIALALEDEYSITIAEDDMDSIVTINDLVSYIKSNI